MSPCSIWTYLDRLHLTDRIPVWRKLLMETEEGVCGMSEGILCVDDDANILDGYKRHLRKEFKLETAVGPEHGLQIIAEQGPFAVVVC